MYFQQDAHDDMTALLDQKMNAMLDDDLMKKIVRGMGEFNVSGLHLSIIKELPFQEPVAFSVSMGDAVTIETTMPLGSNSKLIALFALDKALQAHGYTLDTPIKQILPGFEGAERPAMELWTCKDIARHMTGLPRYDQIIEPGLTAKAITERVRYLQSTAAFRTRFQYNNISSAVLMQIIQHLSGQTFAEFVRQEVFLPLKMEASTYQVSEKTAMGHYSVVGANGESRELLDLEFRYSDCPGLQAAVGALSTGRDMLKWLEAIPTFPLFPTAASPIVTNGVSYPVHPMTLTTYGLYLPQSSYFTLKTIEHTGDTNSHASLILFCPELRLKFAVLFDIGDYQNGMAFTSFIRATLLDRFAGYGSKNWIPEVRQASKELIMSTACGFNAIQGETSLPPLTGTFECPGFLTWEIDLSNNTPLRPELTTIPVFERLHGAGKLLFTPVIATAIGMEGEGWYAGCIRLTLGSGVNKGKVLHGSPFTAQLSGASKHLLVYDLLEKTSNDLSATTASRFYQV
ncbi:hypothetical protein IAT40_002149 [Kwoniella sp. CBS 6097]